MTDGPTYSEAFLRAVAEAIKPADFSAVDGYSKYINRSKEEVFETVRKDMNRMLNDQETNAAVLEQFRTRRIAPTEISFEWYEIPDPNAHLGAARD